MKRNLFLFLTALLLLPGIRCFGLADALFLKEHACVHADDAMQHCTVKNGETLSEFAHVFYGHGRLYPTIMEATPSIVDANVIHAGDRITIPDMPTADHSIAAIAPSTPRVQPRVIVSGRTILDDLRNNARATDPYPETATLDIPTDAMPKFPALSSYPIVTTEPVTTPASKSNVSIPTQDKITGYEFTVNGSDLHGPLQTQLVLFNSEEEKKLGLPIERIDLKPSLAISAPDGGTAVFVRLKKKPAEPFMLLVGGINTPIDSTQLRPRTGKTPGPHALARTIMLVAKVGTPIGTSFLFGGPIGASIVTAGMAAQRVLHLVVAAHEKAHEHKLEAAQAAVDKSKLALYRASIESNTLSKEISR